MPQPVYGRESAVSERPEAEVSRVTHNSVQILPDVGDERAAVTAWSVQQCLSADNRVKFPQLAKRAEQYIVEAS